MKESDNDGYHDYKWLDDIHKESYGPKEVKRFKIILPIGRIIQFIKKRLKS